MNRISAACARNQSDRRAVLAACVVWMLLLGIPVRAEPQTWLPEYSPRRDSIPAVPAAGEKSSAVAVHHVVLGPPNGVLIGRVVIPSGTQAAGTQRFQQATPAVANLRVALVRDGRAVALTRTDRSGRFALRNLSPGQYQVVVDGPGSPSRRACRAWAHSSAPPTARAGVDIVLGEGIVRGQSLFPILSFPQTAAIAGVAAGAIAAPIIYHNVQTANRGPASP